MKLKIVSDGLVKLIDGDSNEMVHLIQKISWKATSDDIFITRTSVEILNVPIEVTTKAIIYLEKYDETTGKFISAGEVEKIIKITSCSVEPETPGMAQEINIYDVETNKPMSGIQEVILEVDTNGSLAKVRQILFDKKYGVRISYVEEATAKLDPIDVREFGNVFTDIYATGKGSDNDR